MDFITRPTSACNTTAHKRAEVVAQRWPELQSMKSKRKWLVFLSLGILSVLSVVVLHFHKCNRCSTEVIVAEPGLHISLSVSTNIVHALDPIIIECHIENDSTNRLLLLRCPPMDPSLISVVGTKGTAIPKTIYGKRVEQRLRRGDGCGGWMDPGRRLDFKLPLNLLYDMTDYGEYVVQSRVVVRVDEGHPTKIAYAESNVLRIEVFAIDRLIGTMRKEANNPAHATGKPAPDR